ncbi:MAG: TetR/AcrR family transcriptional regulator [Rhodobacteraceae bacterium]|nr:TetR/AcrR family transcriptional regulator [Paracoccaceae bacterium]
MSSKNPNTRSRILEAAWDLLEAGASKVRMSDIAKAAGVSRQAVYLHFPSRADLLVEVTHHIDAAKGIDARLAPSRTAERGEDRLALFVEAWGNYIPEIYGVGRALIAMQESDLEARKAWGDRMQAVRHGCAAAVSALARDGALREGLEEEAATDLLWAMLSVANWEQLVRQSGWTQEAYVRAMQDMAARILVR